MRCPRIAILITLFVPALLLAEDKINVKLKRSAQGDVNMQEREQTKKEAITITGPDGNVLQDKTQTTVEVNKFRQEIIEKKAGQSPNKVKRTFSEATRKTEADLEKRAYHGKEVLIEKKASGYVFSIDGKELTTEEAGELPSQFNANKASDDEIDKVLLPGKAVAVNEAWTVEGKKLMKNFGEEEKVAKMFDVDKVKASGKLVKAYKKDGQQHGVVEYQVSVPMKSLEGMHPCRDGAKMELTITLEGCIDGTVEPTSANMQMKRQAASRPCAAPRTCCCRRSRMMSRSPD
jgi:hypothetical protein